MLTRSELLVFRESTTLEVEVKYTGFGGPLFCGEAMKEVTPMVEYGVPIDAQTMVEPPDVAELELEPGHPGLGDEGYVRRRKELFALCRRHRLEDLGPPIIQYTPE